MEIKKGKFEKINGFGFVGDEIEFEYPTTENLKFIIFRIKANKRCFWQRLKIGIKYIFVGLPFESSFRLGKEHHSKLQSLATYLKGSSKKPKK